MFAGKPVRMPITCAAASGISEYPRNADDLSLEAVLTPETIAMTDDAACTRITKQTINIPIMSMNSANSSIYILLFPIF